MIFKIKNLDKSQLTELAKTHLDNMLTSTFDRGIEQAIESDIERVLNLDISSTPSEFTISGGATRQTEMKYNSNNYHASEKLDCSRYKEMIDDILIDTGLSEAQKINTYFDLKVHFYKTMQKKVLNNENFIRSIIRDAEAADGIAAQGRFSK